jgi:predicted double-glycine peptidase
MKRLASVAAAAFLSASFSSGTHAGSVDLPIQVGGSFSVPATSLKEARYRSTVPQQYDFSCGSAALSTLLTHHYGAPATEDVVFEEMFRLGDQQKIQREGFSLLDMKRYLEAHGFEADGFEAPLEKLANVGIPAIALINENGYSHFVVIKGLREGRVLIGDPAGGTRAMPQKAFHSMWTNQILFVITNRQEQAKFNLVSDWRTVPRSPLNEGILRQGLGGIVIPKHGPADF